MGIKENLGKNVIRLQEENGYSSKRLAELAGISENHIGLIRKGEANITMEALERLARCLHVTPEHLLKSDEFKLDEEVFDQFLEKVKRFPEHDQIFAQKIIQACIEHFTKK